jgi:molybdenum cofactor cytidylyltransferase
VISAIILAAGQSRRMGRSKMPLPWGGRTVLGQVIHVLRSAGITDVRVVTGGDRQVVEQIAADEGARCIFNSDYALGEMLSSLQAGLRAMPEAAEAALVALGDQPHMQPETVRLLAAEYARNAAPLIVPSYRLRRGHPWLVRRALWSEIMEMRAPASPRDFLNAHAKEIGYLVVETPTILQDLDTPEDYERSRADAH